MLNKPTKEARKWYFEDRDLVWVHMRKKTPLTKKIQDPT